MWPRTYENLITFSRCKKDARRLVSEENHCKHIANNIDSDCVYHIHIDGEVIPKSCTTTRRVDYLLINETKKDAYLIELKTQHIMDAFKQIEVSNDNLQGLLSGYDMKWRVVHKSRTFGMHTHEVTKFRRQHDNLIIRKTPMEESI